MLKHLCKNLKVDKTVCKFSLQFKMIIGIIKTVIFDLELNFYNIVNPLN